MELPDFAQDVITEEVLLAHSAPQLIELEKDAQSGQPIRLGPPGATDAVVYMNMTSGEPLQHINSLYWALARSLIQGVIEAIRTKLVGLVAEMRAGVEPGEKLPTVEIASQAYSVVIQGDHARVKAMHGGKVAVTHGDIASGLGLAASTVSREVTANGGRHRYRATSAHRASRHRARRPKPAKLAVNHQLRTVVEEKLELWWSPRQISDWLVDAYRDIEEMWVSHETIYQSLFIQGKGALRQELWRCLRSGRATRRPKGRAKSTKGQIRNMVMISERPSEVEDRAVPGHGEGDLLMGSRQTAIGTLVERWSRYGMLFGLPDGNTAEAVRNALAETVQRLPDHLWQSLTWDQANLEHGLSQGLIESTNTKIRLLTRIAFGFHGPEPLIALAMLVLGSHQPRLPGRK